MEDGMLKVHGEHDENTTMQMWRALSTGSAARGVLCADGHFGYGHPIGGVIGYTDHISVSGVGFDIACGNMAVKLDMTYDDIKDRVEMIGKAITKRISFGVGQSYAASDRDKTRLDQAFWDDADLWRDAGAEHLKEMARGQLGTIGGGNHYVDLFRDADDDHLWIGVHFGSRGLGHKMTTSFLKKMGADDKMEAPPTLLEKDGDLGQQYIRAIELGGKYAYAGREWVVETIRKMLAAKITKTVHNHHNFAWLETHGNQQMWVVRKGATPAYPGQECFVGGSMGDNAVILEGLDTPAAYQSMYSTVHGAGRVVGRRAAKRTFTPEEMFRWVHDKGVTLFGGDLDESPMAYRRLDDVLKHHVDSVKVNHTLIPFLVCMAPKGVKDPYKD